MMVIKKNSSCNKITPGEKASLDNLAGIQSDFLLGKKNILLKSYALHGDVCNIPPFSPFSLLVPSVTKSGFPSFQKENIDSF